MPPPALRAEPLDAVRPRPTRAAGPIARIAAAWAAGGPGGPYSRRVALLKRLLPAIGASLLLLIALWPRLAPLWERMPFALPPIDLREARELRMLSPRYAGLDRLGRPYVVTAAVGHQVPNRQDLMSFDGPRADMKTHGGADVVITADTGVYQQLTELLDMFGHVTLLHENGTRFVSNSARVDVAHNSAEGNEPVEGHGPSGDVKAQGFRVYDKGDTIVFTGRSDLLLRSARVGVNPAQPPAVPPAVAATAARVEAEAKATPAGKSPAGKSPAGKSPAANKAPLRSAAPAAAHSAAATPAKPPPGHKRQQ
jgi:lipopolysaccharide export system protein LptC